MSLLQTSCGLIENSRKLGKAESTPHTEQVVVHRGTPLDKHYPAPNGKRNLAAGLWEPSADYKEPSSIFPVSGCLMTKLAIDSPFLPPTSEVSFFFWGEGGGGGLRSAHHLHKQDCKRLVSCTGRYSGQKVFPPNV